MGTRSQSPQSPRTKSLSGQDSELPLKEGVDKEVQKQNLLGDENERRHLSADNWTRVREGKSDMEGTLTPSATGSLEAGPQKTDEEEINWLSASTSSSEKNLGGISTPVKRMSGEPKRWRKMSITGRSQDSQHLSQKGNLSLGTAREVEFSGPSDEKVTDSNDTKKSSKWEEFFKLNETEEADRERMDASDGSKSSTEKKEDKNGPKIPAVLSEDELNVCVNPFEFDAARVAGSSEVTNTWVTVDDTSKPRRTSVELMKEWPSSPTSSSKSTPSRKGGMGDRHGEWKGTL
ncbi:hypothetical protein BSL78_05573 [Apostichopus japonicus]|uniref:Uncharacterized protein n=1 Tax=Stichopus japonicus TaxID=307972 RepID=A0A2G8LB88_STIJA|nr:hypothetical protein BSL78_05573 [Apostichopus japonicus]